MTSKPPATLNQVNESTVRTTVTGIDGGGQLFRDSARVIFLKGQKLIYVSQFKPSSDSSVMVELRTGADNWRSDAKIRAVAPTGTKPDIFFRVTVELDRAHSAVIEAPEDDAAPSVKTPAGESVPSTLQEFSAPDLEAIPEPAQPLPPARNQKTAPAFAGDAASDVFKPAPAAASFSKAALTDVVRSVVASELGQLRRELHDDIADQVESALRQSFAAIEAKIEQRLADKVAAAIEKTLAGRIDQYLQTPSALSALQKAVAEVVHHPLHAEDSIDALVANLSDRLTNR